MGHVTFVNGTGWGTGTNGTTVCNFYEQTGQTLNASETLAYGMYVPSFPEFQTEVLALSNELNVGRWTDIAIS